MFFPLLESRNPIRLSCKLVVYRLQVKYELLYSILMHRGFFFKHTVFSIYFYVIEVAWSAKFKSGKCPCTSILFPTFFMKLLEKNGIPITIYIIMLSFYRESFLLTKLQLHHYKCCFFILCLKYSFKCSIKAYKIWLKEIPNFWTVTITWPLSFFFIFYFDIRGN